MYQNSPKIAPVNLQTQPEPIQTKKTQVINSYSESFTQTDISGIITDASESNWTLIAPKSLTMKIIWNFLENCFSQQKKYNSDIYDVYLLIYLSSAKTYNLCRQFLPLPSYQMLYLKYGELIKQEKKNIIDIDKIADVIHEYKTQNGFLENQNHYSCIVNLAIDAFAFKSFSTVAMTSYKNESSNDTITYNNGFIYMLIPLDYRLPPKLLHIEKWCNGNYNESLDEIAENIKNTLILNGFNVWYKSTDGDRFLSNDHELFYQNYVDGRSSDF